MARGHAWQGNMCGKGVMRGKERGLYGEGGMRDKGGCMRVKRGRSWQEIWPLQRTVLILLEYILVGYVKDDVSVESSIVSNF